MVEPDSQFLHALAHHLRMWGIQHQHDQLKTLYRHFRAVLEVNQRINLTRITDPVEAAVKHYADSLALLIESERWEAPLTTLIDVGTGAGFPAFPLAVMRPDWTVTAIDGTAKKVTFLADVCRVLGVANVKPIHVHSTNWPAAPTADVVVARAVARLPKIVSDTATLVAPGSRLVAYKTRLAATDDEWIEAQRQCAASSLDMDHPVFYELHCAGERMDRALYPMSRSVRKA